MNNKRGLLVLVRFRGLLNIERSLMFDIAPGVLPDADDTAKTIITLSQLGEYPDPSQMIEHFRTKQGHFFTYPGERNASFSTNCNVLQSLLHSKNVQDYKSQISSITDFLCDSWWAGNTHDKWVSRTWLWSRRDCAYS